MLDPSETIVALSSHPGPAARGVVRLSGPQALAIALEGLEGVGAPIPIRPTVYQGHIRLSLDPPRPSSFPSPLKGGKGGGDDREDDAKEDTPSIQLPATLLLWPGPRSYTGQPVAEIHTIGAPPILEHLVARCLARGARLAERGEFTLRAFLAGRIDLAQSEAVRHVIEARTPARLDAALRQLAGGIAGPVREVRDRLLDRLVELEANLDFVDESDVPPIVRAGLIADLAGSADRLAALMARHRARDRPDARPLVVLAGAPNAGKSRLFNALLGDARAIVAPLAGTTRDDLSASLECDGLLVELIDTAGEETSASPIAAAAQARRAARVDEADLIVLCVPSDGPASDDADPRTLLVLTKIDLFSRDNQTDAIATSAATGEGLAALRSAIGSRLREVAIDSDLGPQSAEALERAAESVRNALRLASGGGHEELIAVEIRQAVDELGKVVGAVVSEDILDRIFRRFCVGK